MFRNAYVLLLLTTLFWGGNAVAGKLAVGHVSPMMLNLLRWSIALAVLFTFTLPQLKRDWPIVRKNSLMLFALGAVGFTMFNAALYSALHYTTAINVSIEQAAIPMFIFAANFVLYRMGVTAGQIIGFLLSLVGIAITASHGDLATLAQLEINRGDGLMLLAILFYAGYTVALRYKPAMHWQSLMTVMCFAAFASAIPFAAWEYLSGNAVMPDALGWATTLYTAILPSIGSQLFYMRGVELIGANRAGLFINLVPIFGTLLSILILGEAFHLYHAVAIILVMGGIWLAETSGRKRAAANGTQ